MAEHDDRFSRRRFMRGASAGLLTSRAVAAGLPLSFLAHGSIGHAQEATKPTGLLLITGNAGDPLNANCPGTYPKGGDDAYLAECGHATVQELGDQVFGTMAGEQITAAGFETPRSMRLGSFETCAAQPWALLPQDLLDRSCFFHHQTGSSIHGVLNNTLTLGGALRNAGRNGTEWLPSYVGQSLGPVLGTVLETPIPFTLGGVQAKGVRVQRTSPEQLKSLFSGGDPVEAERLSRLRADALDRIYAEVKTSGTHAQRTYLDSIARSRRETLDMRERVGSALDDVNGDSTRERIRAAVSLLRVRATPVVTVGIYFGGDNHHDYNLFEEVTGNLSGIQEIQFVWETLKEQGMEPGTRYSRRHGWNLLRRRQPS
ncbi:MAG: hypothetical protein AAFX94_11885, partial [Myxococcota bacterium]